MSKGYVSVSSHQEPPRTVGWAPGLGYQRVARTDYLRRVQTLHKA